MQKKFCDLCSKEMQGESMVKQNVEMPTQEPRLRVVLTVTLDGKFSGDVCHECLMKAMGG